MRDLNSEISGLVSLEGTGRQLLRSEALASSQIEGLSISHKKLAEVELPSTWALLMSAFPPLLEDLCEFMNRDDISPIPQAAIAHAQFELIHPFGDGNGRVGRCLIHVFHRREIASRYVPPISLVLGANKDAYIAGLQIFRTGETGRQGISSSS